MNDERAKAAEMYEEEKRAWQRIEGGGEDEAERRRAEESKRERKRELVTKSRNSSGTTLSATRTTYGMTKNRDSSGRA